MGHLELCLFNKWSIFINDTLFSCCAVFAFPACSATCSPLHNPVRSYMHFWRVPSKVPRLFALGFPISFFVFWRSFLHLLVRSNISYRPAFLCVSHAFPLQNSVRFFVYHRWVSSYIPRVFSVLYNRLLVHYIVRSAMCSAMRSSTHLLYRSHINILEISN